jgi:hypothetical protein
VNAAGYLLLEKGGTADYRYDDDYYKQPTAVVRLSARVTFGDMAQFKHGDWTVAGAGKFLGRNNSRFAGV